MKKTYLILSDGTVLEGRAFGASGDAAGEAQHFYEELFRDADEDVIPGLGDDTVMYVKDGRALCFAGVGKVDSALRTAAILTDDRFDYSDAYIISVGCGGSAEGYSVMGDVVVVTGIVLIEGDGRRLGG
jgi:nucleoside phosphorylase